MIASFFIGLINLIIKALGTVAEAFIFILPPSPFKVLDNIDLPYLNYVNWVIPFDFLVGLLGYWVLAIAVYYVAQVVLRWLKVVGS